MIPNNNIITILIIYSQGKGNETPRREPEQVENSEARNTTNKVPEELSRVTRYRAPNPIIDDIDLADTVKSYTSVRCAKEAKEVNMFKLKTYISI